jgi:hypothetical protein
MRPESQGRFTHACAIAAFLALAGSGWLAAAEKYQIHLSPMPFTDATQPVMTGKGTATATLDGETLTIAGTFTGLASPATKAQLSLSVGPGIPGTAIGELVLVVSKDVTGKLTGQVKLQPSQIAALQGNRLYVQIDTEKVPTGTLWGWFLPEQEIVGPDVPQKGPWYIPPFAVKTK